MNARFFYASITAILWGMSVLCGAYMLVSYDLGVDGGDAVGYFLGIFWLLYLLAGAFSLGLLFNTSAARIANRVSVWQAVVGLSVLGVAASFPLTIAGGVADNSLIVGIIAFALGFAPIALALAAERSGVLPNSLHHNKETSDKPQQENSDTSQQETPASPSA